MSTFRFSSAGKLCANALILAACVAAIQGSAHAGLVLDPGFESAMPADYTAGPIGDGWSVLSGAVGIFANGGVGTAHSGVQFADLDLGGTQNQISQDITTTIGQMYTISFWLSDDVGSNAFSATFGATTLDTIPSTTALGTVTLSF